MRGNAHVRFGRRAGETDRPRGRHRAPVRPHIANERLDEVRRRVQNETLGHRGRKSDPLYRTRRLLVMADERLAEPARERRRGLLAAGDPKGQVADAWTAKEAVRELYRIGAPDLALEWVDELADTLDNNAYGPELRRLGRTLRRWAPQIAAWHTSRASNGPVEAINNLSKRAPLRRTSRLVQARHHHPGRPVNFRRAGLPTADAWC
jgi:transposase